MMRKYLTLVLAGCCGWPLFGHAAQTTTTASAAAPAISDVETVRYLSSADLTLWKEAAKKISDGEGKVSDGKFYQSRTEDPTSIVKLDIADTHKKGDAMVKEGNALIKDGKAEQDKLRKIAIAKRDAAHQQAAATGAASFGAPTGQWPEAIHDMSASILAELDEEKYTKLYFGGVYAFEEPKYEAKPELSAQLHDQLRLLDQEKNLLSTQSTDGIKLAQENNKLIVSYPARSTEALNGTKSALIVGEVLYETHNGYAAFALRAIDLSNLHVVASQVMMLSVEPIMAKMLGLPAFRVMARREAPPAPVAAAPAGTSDAKPASKSAAPVVTVPTPVVTVNLQDPNDTLASFKNSSFVFRLASSGHADTLENRFAALVVKAYFHDQLPQVTISDQDFLTMALPTDTDADAAASPADVNTAWVLPNVTDLNVPSIDLDSLTARDLNKNAAVKIGKITITRNLPKVSLPPADELRAAGYSSK